MFTFQNMLVRYRSLYSICDLYIYLSRPTSFLPMWQEVVKHAHHHGNNNHGGRAQTPTARATQRNTLTPSLSQQSCCKRSAESWATDHRPT